MGFTIELTKADIIKECENILLVRTKLNESEINKLDQSQAAETKSSAGDKYETSREMMQRERDNLINNLQANKQLLATLAKIDPHKNMQMADVGALIKTENGLYFLSVGLGKITVMEQTVFVVSKSSPIGLLLQGKRVDEIFTFNNQVLKILAIC